MSKRARWLVVLGFVLPGLAQILSGSRKLGRVGLTASIVLILGGIVTVLGLLFARVATLTVLTNGIVLFVLQWLLVAYAALWLVLGLNTLKLIRLPRVPPNWRMPVAALSVILTLVPVAGAAWAASSVAAGRGALGSIFAGAPAVEPVDGRYNFLLLGTDAGADRDGLRPDSISVVSVDAETGQSVIIGVPRELENTPFVEGSPMATMHPNGFGVAPNEFGEYGGCGIGRCILNGIYAEAENFYPELYPKAKKHHSTPGIEATRDAVEGSLGLKIQFYVLVNMDGFASLIDALGGVTLNVPERLPIGGGIDAYSGELVNVDGWIEPGKQKLNGFQAQWFARSRYGSALGDYARMQRQRDLQAAILTQMTPANVLVKFKEVAAAGTLLIETDIPESMLGRLVDLADKSRKHDIVNVELVPPTIEPVYPDFGLIRQLVADGVTAASPPKTKDK